MSTGRQDVLSEPPVDAAPEAGSSVRLPRRPSFQTHPLNPGDTPDFDGIVARAKELGRDTFIVATSGGKDSGVVLDMAHKRGVADGVFYIRTNTGVKLTEDFVAQRARDYGLKLYVREPRPHPYVYVAFCLQVGFPGPALHTAVMSYLKYRTMYGFVSERRFRGKNVALLSGIRKFESARRRMNYPHPIASDSGRLWFVNPIFYQTTEEVYRYYVENGVKRSPVYDVYPSSLECGCGSFAQGRMEMDAIRQLDPARADFFEWLADGIRRFGTDKAKRHATWGGADWADAEAASTLADYFEATAPPGSDPEAHADHAGGMASYICGAECGAGTMRGGEDY